MHKLWDISIMDFLILSFASFRLTRLIVYDAITEFLRAPFFDEVEEINQKGEKEVYYIPVNTPIKGFLGNLLNCYWCTGIWCSMIVCLVYFFLPYYSFLFLLMLAVAGFAALIETVLQRWIK